METPRGGVRQLIRSLGQLGREARSFGWALGAGDAGPGKLLIVGTPTYEPWHFTAHLTDEARRSRRPDLAPTLVRWQIDAGAPAHLSVSVDEVARASRTSTVLAIPDGDDPGLLERISDARKRGARVMTIDRGGSLLDAYSHEYLLVDTGHTEREYDLCQHIVTAVAPAH